MLFILFKKCVFFRMINMSSCIHSSHLTGDGVIRLITAKIHLFVEVDVIKFVYFNIWISYCNPWKIIVTYLLFLNHNILNSSVLLICFETSFCVLYN
jgi:hypothetical protein